MKTDHEQNEFWNLNQNGISLLTFQSRAHRYLQPRIRTVASAEVVTFVDCTGSFERLLTADSTTNLGFIGEVTQCHEFDVHPISELSDQFTQANQREQSINYQSSTRPSKHGHCQDGARLAAATETQFIKDS